MSNSLPRKGQKPRGSYRPGRGGWLRSLTPQQRRELATSGGHAVSKSVWAHRFTPEEAAAAGRLGGLAVSADRQYMAMLARRGRRPLDPLGAQDVIERLRQLCQSPDETCVAPLPRSRMGLAIQRHFGSLRAACQAAGVEYLWLRQPWTKRLIKDAMHYLAKYHSKLNDQQIAVTWPELTAAVHRLYGTFRHARVAAGFECGGR